MGELVFCKSANGAYKTRKVEEGHAFLAQFNDTPVRCILTTEAIEDHFDGDFDAIVRDKDTTTKIELLFKGMKLPESLITPQDDYPGKDLLLPSDMFRKVPLVSKRYR